MPKPHRELRIGLVSDTHGLVRPEALRALAGCEHLLHAGDIGRREVLEALRAVAPVAAVRGNNDTGSWASAIPHTLALEFGPVRIYMLHDLAELRIDPAGQGFHVVVSGHSHKPVSYAKDGVLYVNPGSAGPRRFTLPVSVGHLIIRGVNVQATLRTLEVMPAKGGKRR